MWYFTDYKVVVFVMPLFCVALRKKKILPINYDTVTYYKELLFSTYEKSLELDIDVYHLACSFCAFIHNNFSFQ